MDSLFIFGAKYLYLLSVAIGIYAFWKQFEQRRSMFKFAIFAFPISFVIAKILNKIYDNPRPFVSDGVKNLIEHAPDNGFPSDHTLLVAAIASVVMFYNRKIGAALWVIAAVIAWSRVYVGVHHIIDVLGSIIISLATALVIYYLGNFKQNASRNITTTPETHQ